VKRLREFLGWFFGGQWCPRCGVERTGYWTRYVTGVPFDEWVCVTCEAVEEIKRRAGK
jgi:hypothetical protein